jgi:hypothetical protein
MALQKPLSANWGERSPVYLNLAFSQVMMDEKDKEDDTTAIDIFQEPADFYQPDKAPTFVNYTLQDGRALKLRLVGHSPLWV